MTPTNITPEIKEHFEALSSGKFNNFALFSCFVNGQPAAAIVAVTDEDDANYRITPLFVSLTPNMVLTDHDGAVA
jgi:hypothetical protein